MMNKRLIRFLRIRGVDSFQKLTFLLFLQRRPHFKGTIQEFARRLHLGDMGLLKKIIDELQRAGVVECIENHYYKLCDEPGLKTYLREIAGTFEDPLARQELLEWVTRTPRLSPGLI